MLIFLTMSTTFDAVLRSPAYQKAKKDLLEAIRGEITAMKTPREPQGALKEQYEELLRQIQEHRGRELFYKFMPTGAGNGPFIELCDGSVKYDLITGIGVNFWGHGNLELLEAEFDGIWGEVMQGNLGPNRDHLALIKALIASAPKTRLKNVWLTTCGAAANEIALKIIRQKKAPATKIFAFHNCFAGRTTALQEITDNPKYREGQPVYGEVFFLNFFDPNSKVPAKEQGIAMAAAMSAEIAKNPGKYAGFEFEIVQGEGGFHFAPNEFMVPILEVAKKNGIAVWADEIQTFGRTGEYFCFQRIGIDEYIDVVTVAKLLQAGAVMYSTDFNPKAGLISGTFSSSSAAIRAGIKAMQILKERIVGPQGRVAQLEKITITELERLKSGSCSKYLQDYTVVGGMIAFTLFDGTMDPTKKFLFNLFEMGAIAFFCGHGPYRARMLPPFGVMTDDQLRDVFTLLEKAILKTAKELNP